MRSTLHSVLRYGYCWSAAPHPPRRNVKVTPLGSHAGELCSRDRATIFEDPTGLRILYDAGHSVTVYPALSGKTMEFDGDGKCMAGCS
jgi:hypothetical protein